MLAIAIVGAACAGPPHDACPDDPRCATSPPATSCDDFHGTYRTREGDVAWLVTQSGCTLDGQNGGGHFSATAVGERAEGIEDRHSPGQCSPYWTIELVKTDPTHLREHYLDGAPNCPLPIDGSFTIGP